MARPDSSLWLENRTQAPILGADFNSIGSQEIASQTRHDIEEFYRSHASGLLRATCANTIATPCRCRPPQSNKFLADRCLGKYDLVIGCSPNHFSEGHNVVSSIGSVTKLVGLVERGDVTAAQRLWDLFAMRMLALARISLGNRRFVVADEEDVVQGGSTWLYGS